MQLMRSYLNATLWYFLFGLLHELSHVFITSYLIASSSTTAEVGLSLKCWLCEHIRWEDIILNRRFDLDLAQFHADNAKQNIFIIRHFGWIVSVIIAFMLHFVSYRMSSSSTRVMIREGNKNKKDEEEEEGNQSFRWCKWAAYATAIDAIWTDLLQMEPPLSLTFSSSSSFITSTTFHAGDLPNHLSTVSFFCGNFGVILLHSAWLYEDGGQTTLDILRKMIEVTMMRGAQSGGIVTFHRNNKKGDDENGIVEMKSIRSRVVKSKRGDL